MRFSDCQKLTVTNILSACRRHRAPSPVNLSRPPFDYSRRKFSTKSVERYFTHPVHCSISHFSRSFDNQPLTVLFRYSFYYQLLYIGSSFWAKFMFYPNVCESSITQRYHLRTTIIYRNSILSLSIIIENFWICKFSILWTSERKSQEQTSLKLIIIYLNGEVYEYRSWLLVNYILKFQGKSAVKMPRKKFVSNTSPDIVRAFVG